MIKLLTDLIDRDSFEPAYVQLVNIIRKHIASGAFLPGSKLPSESALRKKYGVSPMTVRRAINILIEKGIVDTIQGKGTFVKAMDLGNFAFQLNELQSIFSDREKTSIKLLKVNLAFADDQIASKLGISKGDRIINIRRLISNNDEPIILNVENLLYDPLRPLVESEMEVTNLGGLLTGNGKTDLKKGEFTIEAAMLHEEESKVLDAPPLAPAVRLEHVFFDFEDQPTSWGWFICRGDRMKFSTKVGIWE